MRVDPLDAHTVQHAAVGEDHMLAVVDNGQLATWGGNDRGQAGTCKMYHICPGHLLPQMLSGHL